MNTKLISRVSIATLLLIIIALNSSAQKTVEKNESVSELSSHEINKVSLSGSIDSSSDSENSDLDEMALQNFNKEPLSQPNAKLEQLGDKFLVTFATGETLTRALFDKTGTMIYSINYCSGKQLPQYVMRLLKKEYENYTITSAARVLEENRQIWLLKLAGENKFIAIRLDGSEIKEVENFNKAE